MLKTFLIWLFPPYLFQLFLSSHSREISTMSHNHGATQDKHGKMTTNHGPRDPEYL
jgi:hypothetical protein